jgi:hypothetical protein
VAPLRSGWNWRIELLENRLADPRLEGLQVKSADFPADPVRERHGKLFKPFIFLDNSRRCGDDDDRLGYALLVRVCQDAAAFYREPPLCAGPYFGVRWPALRSTFRYCTTLERPQE